MAEIPFASYKLWGGPVSRERYNRLVDLIQMVTVGKGINYTVKRSSAGTTLITNGKGATGAPTYPLDAIVLNADGTLTCTFVPGTSNGLLPDNIFDTFDFDADSVYYVKVHSLSDGTSITSCTMEVDTTAPAPVTPVANALPTEVDTLIGVLSNGAWYRTVYDDSIILIAVEQYRVDKSPPAGPGVLSYVPYYTWLLQNPL